MHHSPDIYELTVEKQPRPACHDQGQPRALLPQQRQIQEKAERLITKQLCDFQRNEVTDEALRRDMTSINRSLFTDEIEQAEPPRKFSMQHFTSSNEMKTWRGT
ncbi:hypothetical protein ACFX2I_040730 [Malus domestica]